MKNYTISLILIFLLCACTHIIAQQPEDTYKKPLKEVLGEVESRHKVKLVYEEEVVKDQLVDYAHWRFRDDPEKTLTYILSPLDLVFDKTAAHTYEIRKFQYHRRAPEEGQKHLDRLFALYSDVEGWEMRQSELRECMLEELGLSPLPSASSLKPVNTAVRKMKGYSVQNLAIESLPGVFVTGALYRPQKGNGPFPLILVAQGHSKEQHFGESSQLLSATLARMGAMVFSYDMFAQGESTVQFDPAAHRTGLAMSMQVLNGMRIIDYFTSLPSVDPERIGMTGASGGGTQTFLLAALDQRIAVSVPVVQVSSWFYGGCPCESGMPVHTCGAWGSNNAEIAAMAAPRPLLVVSDGKDWTANVPEIEFPYIKKVYGLYGKEQMVENAHFSKEGHDYGPSKRAAAYQFLAQHLGLDMKAVKGKNGLVDESKSTVEQESSMLVFGENGVQLPAHAIKGFDALQELMGNANP